MYLKTLFWITFTILTIAFFSIAIYDSKSRCGVVSALDVDMMIIVIIITLFISFLMVTVLSIATHPDTTKGEIVKREIIEVVDKETIREGKTRTRYFISYKDDQDTLKSKEIQGLEEYMEIFVGERYEIQERQARKHPFKDIHKWEVVEPIKERN